jgi:hypothetical protein
MSPIAAECCLRLRIWALVFANRDPTYRPILTHTYGILFLGTPHQGSKAADIGTTLCRVAQMCFQRPSTNTLELLKKDSYALVDLSREFSFVLPQVKIVNFYETKETIVSHKMIPGLKVNFMVSS